MKSLAPLSAADLFQVGHWFRRQDRLFEIVAWDPQEPLQVEARAADDSTIQRFTLTELFAPTPLTRFAATRAELAILPASGADELSQVVDAACLPPHLLSHADHIIQIVEAVQAHLEQIRRSYQLISAPFSLTEATRQACQALTQPMSLSGYYKYRRHYQAHDGDRSLMAAALHRSTYGKTRIDPNAQHFIDTVIRRFYRSNPPMRAQTVYNVARQLWQHNRHWWLNFQQEDGTNSAELVERLLDVRQGVDALLSDPACARRLAQIKLPSQSWFYGYVSWFSAQPGEGAKTYVARHGQADWEANFLLFDSFARTATLPLQYVFADHYRLDVLHVDDEYREMLSRLWLTLLIDAFSRTVLGLFLAYEDPTIESTQGALRHAIWPKTRLDEFGIDLPWACYGIPQRLFLDNAWAHHSYSLEELARALAAGGRYTQMELVFRPPYQARYGGLVERLFGNLSGQLREMLPGALLKPDQRHWHNASQGACLLYRDIVRVVHQLVVDYLHTPHRELDGLTPHEKWLSGLQLMTPVPPPFTPQLERCFWRLHSETRLATHSGLCLFGLHYWSPKLAGMRSPDRQGRRRRFHLRYDPADLSHVAVFEHGIWLGDGYARELRLPDGHYEPVSVWEMKLTKELARQRNGQPVSRPHSWLVHLLEARELIAQRQAEQKLIRRKVEQLRERRKGRPRSATQAQRQEWEAVRWEETARAMDTTTAPDHDPRTHLFDTLREVL
jgi:hypothetical protein